MIVEQRTYTLQPGKGNEYLATYAEYGMKVQKQILGHMVGYYQTEIGELNQIIHMWGYDSFEDRLARRAKLFADPTWLAYVGKVRPFILRQESKILLPAPFFTVPK